VYSPTRSCPSEGDGVTDLIVAGYSARGSLFRARACLYQVSNSAFDHSMLEFAGDLASWLRSGAKSCSSGTQVFAKKQMSNKKVCTRSQVYLLNCRRRYILAKYILLLAS